MEWDHAAYPPEVLRCSFGDRAREGDGASWRALAEQLEDHAWVIAAPEVREPRSAAPSLSIWTYTMHAARRHDVPVAERRVLEEMRWLVGQLSTWAERIGRELELTYEGEEIGWIVRGEVSEELRRFLDRWERTLRDDVASRVQRDEGRVDDGDEGKVSIWLGDLHDEAELAALLVPASPARSPLRRALGLRTVPEGELEARWAPRSPVGALLAPMSFGASFADVVAAVARARGIDTASAVIAYFDHAHDPAQALPEQDGARLRFVGVFSYDDAVEARPASEVEPMPARLATQVRPWRHYLPRLHDHRAATAERLDTLERSLGATLPPDYRVFLRHLGGAVPSAGTLVGPIDDLAWKAGPVAVGSFSASGSTAAPRSIHSGGSPSTCCRSRAPKAMTGSASASAAATATKCGCGRTTRHAPRPRRRRAPGTSACTAWPRRSPPFWSDSSCDRGKTRRSSIRRASTSTR
ncbi:MAG: hypothetical protein IPH44_33895 [Myxococcales bacterium]|nr:hypothetical protein [Myxococcales bacterium]